MDRPNYMATPGAVVPSSDSTSLRKVAMAAALLTAVVGGAVLGTFVFGDSTSAPSPSVYMVPETNTPALAPAPVAAPPAPSRSHHRRRARPCARPNCDRSPGQSRSGPPAAAPAPRPAAPIPPRRGLWPAASASTGRAPKSASRESRSRSRCPARRRPTRVQNNQDQQQGQDQQGEEPQRVRTSAP